MKIGTEQEQSLVIGTVLELIHKLDWNRTWDLICYNLKHQIHYEKFV